MTRSETSGEASTEKEETFLMAEVPLGFFQPPRFAVMKELQKMHCWGKTSYSWLCGRTTRWGL